ncbi:MAG: hypothetical protein JXA54_14180 [Candidatus Heimdallarchaeota archaeon]|nr:hypothetical protein [Candidatus Heimdallarchaeota archaeon]
MIDQVAQTNAKTVAIPLFSTYHNKKSKMNESILVQYHPEQRTISIHIYAMIIEDVSVHKSNSILIDMRKTFSREFKSPLRVIGQINNGSLSLFRFFIKNTNEEKYLKKLREKYPNKKVKSNKYFPPFVLLMAHYCNQFELGSQIDNKPIADQIANSLANFDESIQEDIHQTLRTIGKPFYLKGQRILELFHQTRELPEIYLKKLIDEKMLNSISNQKSLSVLLPIIKGTRREANEQLPLITEQPLPSAISQIIDSKGGFIPLTEQRFPIAVIGEPESRQQLILNILKNANARFLILDPKESYGRLASVNPRIRGYLLGSNFHLNIISTEGDRIRDQVYAYWFARIIAYLANLRAELAKTIETYLLGAYRDPSNQTKAVFQFRDFANQELTSEVTKMGRNESNIVANVLYPLGTYEEISLITKIGNSLSFDTLFETKGTIIQFSKNDDQLTKIAYLFTLLKLRSITNTDPKILVLENIDEILGGSKYSLENDLTDLIVGLAENYHLVLSGRSPLKIQELIKHTSAKFINRLIMYKDKELFTNEYRLSKVDETNLSKLSLREFMVLVQDFSTAHYIKIDPEMNTRMPLEIDNLEQESSKRIINSKDYLQNTGMSPEIKRIIFELLKLLREKPKRILPEEGLEQLIDGCSKTDILRAKEIARNEALIKMIESSPDDSNEKISLLKLTERGEEYYRSYLNLQKQIPLISFTSHAVEKNFERDILERLGKVDKFVEVGNYSEAIDYMLEISVRLLAVLPEEDRFRNGKEAAKLLEKWSYLSSLKETGNTSIVKRLYMEFSQVVVNGIKAIKQQTIMTDELVQSEKPKKPDEISDQDIQNDDENPNELENDDDFEIDFKIANKSTNEPTKIDMWKKQVEVIEEENNRNTRNPSKENSSLFKAAAADLRSAGMPHIDDKGDIYTPQKGNIFADDFFEHEPDLEILNKNPFAPVDNKDDLATAIIDNKLAKLDQLKSKLMIRIAQALGVSNIDDEKFIWHVLETRYNGKVDEKYTISEIVTLMKVLYQAIKNKALISEKTIAKIDKLISSENLLPENLVIDLKQYVQEL